MFEPIDRYTPPESPDFIRDFPPARTFSKKGSFVWWWWMFLFEENGVKKQIVAYWTTKTYKNVNVNGVNWGPKAEIKGTPDKFTYNGLATAWYYDGKSFQEIKPKNAVISTIAGKDSMEVNSDDFALAADRKTTKLRFHRDVFNLDVQFATPSPPIVGYKRTLLTKKMGFDQQKIYHAFFTGKLASKDDAREIKGSVYMQHICLNTPAFPWLWGVFHKDDGSYLTYFTTFIGRQMFRRNSKCKPKWDNRMKLMNKNLNYTPKGQATKRFKHVRYKVFRQENGLPGFEASGVLEGETLRVKVITKAKTTYAFSRWKLWRNRFFYNEFPSEVVELEYTDKNGKIHKETGESWNGNCEYSWGTLLN
ncbi:MAG: hypothetical protein R6W91_07570 [Thermoplasmata archaeon]